MDKLLLKKENTRRYKWTDHNGKRHGEVNGQRIKKSEKIGTWNIFGLTNKEQRTDHNGKRHGELLLKLGNKNTPKMTPSATLKKSEKIGTWNIWGLTRTKNQR